MINITNQLRQRRINLILPYLKKDMKILGAGSGDGWFVNDLNERIYNCIGVDKRERDLMKLPFKNNTFDCITAFNVLDYCDCEYEYELKRVLRDDGLEVILVVICVIVMKNVERIINKS